MPTKIARHIPIPLYLIPLLRLDFKFELVNGLGAGERCSYSLKWTSYSSACCATVGCFGSKPDFSSPDQTQIGLETGLQPSLDNAWKLQIRSKNRTKQLKQVQNVSREHFKQQWNQQKLSNQLKIVTTSLNLSWVRQNGCHC